MPAHQVRGVAHGLRHRGLEGRGIGAAHPLLVDRPLRHRPGIERRITQVARQVSGRIRALWIGLVETREEVGCDIRMVVVRSRAESDVERHIAKRRPGVAGKHLGPTERRCGLLEFALQASFESQQCFEVAIGEEAAQMDVVVPRTDPVDATMALHQPHRIPRQVVFAIVSASPGSVSKTPSSKSTSSTCAPSAVANRSKKRGRTPSRS